MDIDIDDVSLLDEPDLAAFEAVRCLSWVFGLWEETEFVGFWWVQKTADLQVNHKQQLVDQMHYSCGTCAETLQEVWLGCR